MAVEDTIDTVVVEREIGIKGRVDGKAGDVEHIMESARRKPGEAIVVVGERLRDSVGTMSGCMPLGDGDTIKLVVLDHHDALAGRELKPNVMGGIV